MLKDKFEFYALSAHPDVRRPIGIFQKPLPRHARQDIRHDENQSIYSLALDKAYPKRTSSACSSLGNNFYVVPFNSAKIRLNPLMLERKAKGFVYSPASDT